MRKKYFFFDIDGTLTDRSTGLIVPSAREALEKLKAAGHFIAINTGRAHYKARKFFDQHGFDNMVCNGGMGIVINRELVENRPIDFEKALWLYQYCIDNGIGVLAACDDSQKVYAKDFTFYDQVGPRREPTTYIIDPDFDPRDFGTIYKLYTATTEERRRSLPFPEELGYVNFEPDYTIVQHDDKRLSGQCNYSEHPVQFLFITDTGLPGYSILFTYFIYQALQDIEMVTYTATITDEMISHTILILPECRLF